MSNNPTDLRNRLLDIQEMTPALREACHQELAAMLEYRLTPRTRLYLSALLSLMIAFVIVGTRALFFYNPGPQIYGAWAIFTITCTGGALWIGWAIWRGPPDGRCRAKCG